MAVAFTVELLLNAVWVDVSAYVRLGSGVLVKHGVSSESGTADPATCSLVWNNRDGRFTPKNTAGPYYPYLKRNTPLRFTVGATARFYGEVSEFPARWNLPGTDVWVPVVASGVLRRLVRANDIRSPLSSGLAGLGANLTGYWSMEDGGGSFATAVPGASALTATGTPEYGTIDLGDASGPVAALNASGAYGTPRASTSTDFFFACYFVIPDGGTVDGAVLVEFTTPGTATRWQITYDASFGVLRLQVYSSSGTLVFNTAMSSGSVSWNGQTGFIRIRAANSGADISFNWRVRFLVPGQYTSTTGWEFAGGYTVPGVNITGSPIGVTVNPNLWALPEVGVGHVTVGDSETMANDTTSLAYFINAYDGETVNARMTRVTTLAGIAFTWVAGPAIDAGVSSTVGRQPDGTALDVLRAAEAADAGGILHDTTSSLGLTYLPRIARYDANLPVLELDYTAGQVSPPLEPTDDDANIRNDVTVTRSGGATGRATDTTSAVNALDYPTGIGSYPYAVTLDLATDTQVPNVAGWLLNQGTVDETRYPQLTIDLVLHPTLVAGANALRPGSRVRVFNLPAWVGDTDVDLHVIGWTEVIGSHSRTMTLNCVPAPPFHVVKLDDVAGFGTIDTANKLAL